MLWRRHHPQEEAAGQAEEGQGPDARIWQRQHPAGGLHCCAADGRGIAFSSQQNEGNVGGSENSVGRCFSDHTDAGSRQATEGQYGSVSIPQEAFIAALRMGEK